MAPLLVSTMLGGCMPLHGYGSPRVLRSGDVQHHVTFDLQANATSPRDPSFQEGVPTHVMPRYGLRAGLGSGGEIGGSISLFGAALDLKQQVIDTDLFALALAPGIAATALTEGGSILLARMPLMTEVTLTRWLALRPALSVAYAARLDEHVRGVLTGASLGVALTPVTGVTVEPAASWTIHLDSGFRYYGAGLAIELGASP